MKMFNQKDFDCFKVVGLEKRMIEIRKTIQPKFQELGDYFVPFLSKEIGSELPIHIAQHRRRTAYEPDYTWCAFGGDKRGYKKYPHFTLGINEEYIVMWLSFIDNPEFEKEIAQKFIEELQLFDTLSEDFVINTDHTKNNFTAIKEAQLEKDLIRWRDVKKGEFQIGRIINREDPLLKTPAKARDFMLETYLSLVPFYQLAFEIRNNRYK